MPQGPEGRGDQSTSLSSSPPPRLYTACTYSLCLDKGGQMLQYIAFISCPSLLSFVENACKPPDVNCETICLAESFLQSSLSAQPRGRHGGKGPKKNLYGAKHGQKCLWHNPAFIQHVAQLNSKFLHKRLFYSTMPHSPINTSTFFYTQVLSI